MQAHIPGLGDCDIFIHGPNWPGLERPGMWSGAVILPGGGRIVVGADTKAELLDALAAAVQARRDKAGA